MYVYVCLYLVCGCSATPQACRKSLEAAVRSQRANIAEALRVKLAKLEAGHGRPKNLPSTPGG